MAAEVAKLYADALFEIYIEDGSDDAVHKELNEFAAVFNDNPELSQLLSAPLLTNKEKTDIVAKIFDSQSVVYDFLCLLCDKGRAGYFEEITEVFNKKYNEHKNIADVSVTTSVPLTEELRTRLIAKLGASIGKTVVLKEKTDPGIIDGIIVEYDNKRIDNSVRSGLENLRKVVADTEL
ncbi:MAG: F0F1 ATP synthase subunit delta [Ruminococcus sp.]|jgi:F-type H+-transporting ATPase subunit delta|nr:F0F1 ATP synthase subunit delta [Ruminococcus sp.]